MEKIRAARIEVVATVPGRDELQWLDVTIRRPTAVAYVEEAAKLGGFAPRERRICEQKRKWPGHGETDQLRTGWKTRPADDEYSRRADDEVG